MKAQEIINTLATLRTKSQAINTRAQSINMSTGKEMSSGGGPYPQVIAGLHELMSTMTNFTDDAHSSPDISDAEAKEIDDAYREFVRGHQVFLHLLTGKGALFKSTPEVGRSMQDVLRAERDVVESMGNVLAEAAPSISSDIKGQTKMLSQTITAAIRAH